MYLLLVDVEDGKLLGEDVWDAEQDPKGDNVLFSQIISGATTLLGDSELVHNKFEVVSVSVHEINEARHSYPGLGARPIPTGKVPSVNEINVLALISVQKDVEISPSTAY